MTKEELIKYLRNTSNEMKNILYENQNEYKQISLDLKNYDNKTKNSKFGIFIYRFWTGLTIFISGTIVFKIVTKTDNLMGIDILYLIYAANKLYEIDKSTKEENEKNKRLQNLNANISYNDNQIDNIENSIEFLKSLTKEEEEKYLQLKM